MVEVVDLQIKYKLTPCMAKALYLLLTYKLVTPVMLEVDAPVTTDAKVLIHRIRRRMAHTNITIQSQRGAGYWLDQHARERILRDIEDEQFSLPFDHEGKGEPLAA